MVEESTGSAGEERASFATGESIEYMDSHAMVAASAQNSLTTIEQDKIDQFVIPSSAVAMDIRLSDGKPYVLQGIIDPDSVALPFSGKQSKIGLQTKTTSNVSRPQRIAQAVAAIEDLLSWVQ